jgi:putative ABC transport system permease protein
LVDITTSEVDGVRKLLKAQPGVPVGPELVPVVSSRIVAIDGVAAKDLTLKNFPKRMLQSISLSWSGAVPEGTKVVQGRWWSPNATGVQVAVSEHAAERLGVKLGSTIVFAAQDTQFAARVVAVTRADGQHAYSRVEFALPEPALAGLPVVWYGGVHVDPAKVEGVQRALYNAYPTVTVINVAAALETVRSVVVQITYVIQFLAAFSIFAGVIILASSIAGTRYRRIREVVVLKTLGATRGRIATVFSIEFAVLGLVAGTVGVGFALLIARVLLHKMEVAFQVQWLWTIGALLGTAVLTVGTGWVASHRILGQKPLEVLREE